MSLASIAPSRLASSPRRGLHYLVAASLFILIAACNPSPCMGTLLYARSHESLRLLSQEAINDQLEEQGYGPVWRTQLEGVVYRSEGLSPNGQPVVVELDGYTAEILSQQRYAFLEMEPQRGR